MQLVVFDHNLNQIILCLLLSQLFIVQQRQILFQSMLQYLRSQEKIFSHSYRQYMNTQNNLLLLQYTSKIEEKIQYNCIDILAIFQNCLQYYQQNQDNNLAILFRLMYIHNQHTFDFSSTGSQYNQVSFVGIVCFDFACNSLIQKVVNKKVLQQNIDIYHWSQLSISIKNNDQLNVAIFINYYPLLNQVQICEQFIYCNLELFIILNSKILFQQMHIQELYQYNIFNENELQFSGGLNELRKKNQNIHQLEKRLNGFFNKKGSPIPTEEKKQSPNIKRATNNNNFKLLFNKTSNLQKETQPKQKNQSVQQIMNRKTKSSYQRNTQQFESEKKSKIDEYQNLEKYYQKKNMLMEMKIKQIQQQIQIENQQKVMHYNQNVRLENQLKKIDNEKKISLQQKIINHLPQEINFEIQSLQKQICLQKQRNKMIKKDVEMLKEKCKTLKNKKIQQKQQINLNKDEQVLKLKLQLEKQRQNYKKLKEKYEKNSEINYISDELNKLKKIVETKSRYKYQHKSKI